MIENIEIKPGYLVKIYQKLPQEKREQVFEGIVIAKRGKDVGQTITVRKISHGIGVERIFPLALPSITKIEILKKFKVSRAKLYYLRNYKKRLKEIK